MRVTCSKSSLDPFVGTLIVSVQTEVISKKQCVLLVPTAPFANVNVRAPPPCCFAEVAFGFLGVVFAPPVAERFQLRQISIHRLERTHGNLNVDNGFDG